MKRLLGRDLVTDEFAALFELVKNSFDAHAQRVDLFFSKDRVVVLDDGKGMTADDIRQKWLFVAYSAKRDGSEDADYRHKISARSNYAGSKGVGRFSCDRLGATLRMQTKSITDQAVNVLLVDWDAFEIDLQRTLEDIPITLSQSDGFDTPAPLSSPTTGTLLEITRLREDWPREKLLRLRAALTKLINPFGGVAGAFKIYVHAPEHVAGDEKERLRLPDREDLSHRLVNGRIDNFIFDTLKGKTTHLALSVTPDGKSLVSELSDRGTLIYRIQEPNAFDHLINSGFVCNLFYLNNSAKKTFARRMGVPSVQFGSVFLFRHGFRIFPIGDEHDDTFGIDRRKQQGYARFLGTRDIIGRIDIAGSDDDFRESTSRDMGLINTPAFQELQRCFIDYCFRRLERYVVGVTWEDKGDKELEDSSRLSSDEMRTRITALVERLVGGDEIQLLDYDRDLFRIVDERSKMFSRSMESLRRLADTTNDPHLQAEVRLAEERYRKVQEAEAAARAREDEERKARQVAERMVRSTTVQLEEERRRSLFLQSTTTLDRQIIEELHHQIIIHATNAQDLLTAKISTWSAGSLQGQTEVVSFLGDLLLLNQRILTIAQFSTKANFRMQSAKITDDLGNYLVDYVAQVTPVYLSASIHLTSTNTASPHIVCFRPIEFSMVIDNLISNAKRARASKVAILIQDGANGALVIAVEDDGVGLPEGVETSRLFEKGFTTTRGSGLGLYHVQKTVRELGGWVSAHRRLPRGSRIEIHIPRGGAS